MKLGFYTIFKEYKKVGGLAAFHTCLGKLKKYVLAGEKLFVSSSKGLGSTIVLGGSVPLIESMLSSQTSSHIA